MKSILEFVFNHRDWFLLNAGHGGLDYGTLTTGTGINIGDKASFWLLGQDNSGESASYYNYATDENKMYPGDRWPVEIYEHDANGRYGHCAVNIFTFQYKDTEINPQTVVIGGYFSQYSDRTEHAITYCIGSPAINNSICDVKSEGNHGWSKFPSLNRPRGHHSCTVFDVQQQGQAIIVNGDVLDSEIFFLEQCGLWDTKCSWINETNVDTDGMSLEFGREDGIRYRGAMVTLNNIPTFFGGYFYGSNSKVYQFKNDVHSIYYWSLVDAMASARDSHSVVSVPLDFVCYEHETPSSTQR